MMQAGCTYCHGPLNPTSTGLDRLDNTGGYVTGNVVPSCGPCNVVREAYRFTPMEMMKYGDLIRPFIRKVEKQRARNKCKL
jgi:hypothetical protein